MQHIAISIYIDAFPDLCIIEFQNILITIEYFILMWCIANALDSLATVVL